MIGGARERRKRDEKAKDRARMFSFAGGMQTFPDAIAATLGRDVRLGSTVTSISRTCQERSNGRKAINAFLVEYRQDDRPYALKVDAVVLAVPAYVSAEFARLLSPSVLAGLERVSYPPVAEVFLGFAASQFSRPLDGFGYLIPEKEKRNTLGTIWSSSCFPNRAPDGCVALTTFVGGSRQPHLLEKDDSSLTRLVLDDIHDIMKGSGKPVFSRVVRWDRAIPQYNLGYGEFIDSIGRYESEIPGLFFCNNFRGGIAVGDCVMSGRRTADRVASYVNEHIQESITNP
jgi:oxygen-dependent protoporphyrinogen oxidase